MENEEIDYKRVVEQLRNGGPLFGKDDALAPLLKRLIEYFQYRPVIRKLIYTTNTVEGYHRQVCKVTKNKGVLASDTSLEKLVYLAYRNIREKWTMPLANWTQIS